MTTYAGEVRIKTRLDAAGINEGMKKFSSSLANAGAVVAKVITGAVAGAVAGVVALATGIGLLIKNMMKMEGFKQKFSELQLAFANLKNAAYSALMPLIEALLPAIMQIVTWLTHAANVAAAFFAKLAGASTYSVYVANSLGNAAGSSGEYADNMERAAEAAKGSLASFDKLNVLSKEEEPQMPGTGGGGGGASGAWVVKDVEETLDEITGGWESFVDGLILGFKEGDWDGLGNWWNDYVWEPFIKIGMPNGWESEIDPRNWFQPIEGSKVGEIIDGIWDALWTGIIEWKWDPLGELIFDSIFGEGAWAWLTDEEVFKEWRDGFWAGIKSGIEEHGDLWGWIKDHVFQPIIDAVKGLFGIASPSTEMAEIGGQLIDGLKEGIKDAWSNIGDWFDENVKQPVSEWFTGLWDDIKKWAEDAWSGITDAWSGAETWFSDKVIEPLKGWFTDVWDDIKGFASDAWIDIEETWSTVSTWFSDNVTEPVKTFFSGAWDDIKGFATGAWEDIKSVWNEATTWFNDTIWQPIKDKAGEVWESIKLGAVNIGTDIANGVISAVNGVIGFINSMIDGLENAINGLIDLANRLPFINIPNVDLPSIGLLDEIPRQTLTLPALATGAVIPANAPFAAILGDQRSGTNIEAPLKTIEQAVDNVLARRGINTGADSGLIHNVIKLDGQVLYDAFKKIDKRVGASLVAGSGIR